VTLKVGEPNVCVHMDVQERDKAGLTAVALGRRLVLAAPGGEAEYEYSDLDEVCARHMDPLASHHRSLRTATRVFSDSPQEEVDRELVEAMQTNPARVPDDIFPCAKNVGCYVIGYLLRADKRPHHESVRVVPGGVPVAGRHEPRLEAAGGRLQAAVQDAGARGAGGVLAARRRRPAGDRGGPRRPPAPRQRPASRGGAAWRPRPRRRPRRRSRRRPRRGRSPRLRRPRSTPSTPSSPTAGRPRPGRRSSPPPTATRGVPPAPAAAAALTATARASRSSRRRARGRPRAGPPGRSRDSIANIPNNAVTNTN
jgi:hypothetical protein